MQWIQLILSLTGLTLGGLGAIMGLRTWRVVTRRLDASSTRSLMQLNAEVTELTSAFESLSTTVKRLSARHTMRETRELQKQGHSPLNLDGMSPQEKKSALRKALAEGRVRAIKDDGSPHEV